MTAMTEFVIRMRPDVKASLWNHLLPRTSQAEQAAFLFVTASNRLNKVCFDVVEASFLCPADYSVRGRDYIELSGSAIARTIQRAHRLGACLAEFHSHRLPFPAAFSPSDRWGLHDTVPHMRWRLNRRPYIAAVVAPDSFDALIWTHKRGMVPEPIAAIQVGTELLIPTHLSLGDWNGHRRKSI